MKVWVIMSNDYPHSVYTDGGKAEKFVEEAIVAEDREAAKPIQQRSRSRIYWRAYPFDTKD